MESIFLDLGVTKTFIHIGMPRSASTFFQREIFPFVNDFTFLNVDTTQYTEPFQRLLYDDASFYASEKRSEEIRKLCRGNTLLSNELFAGQSLYLNNTNRTRTAERLQRIFPEGEIILFLREQSSLIQSLYSLGVYSGFTLKPEEFVQVKGRDFAESYQHYASFEPRESAELYAYSSLIALYEQHFPKVHIFLYEEFHFNPEKFVADFCQRLGITLSRKPNYEEKVNASLTGFQIGMLRELNRWRPLIGRNRLGNGLLGFKTRFIEHQMKWGKTFHFSPELVQRIQKQLNADNTKIGETHPELGSNLQFQKHYLQFSAIPDSAGSSID